MNDNNINKDEYKYVEIETRDTLSDKNKKIGIGILLYLLFGLLAGYILVKLLITIFTSNISESNFVFSLACVCIILFLVAILLIKSSGKSKIKEIVKININDKNTCINCGTLFSIENNKCPHCNYSSKFNFECPNCHTNNNVHRNKCIKCGTEITIEDKNHFIKRYRNLYIIYLILSILGIIYFVTFFLFVLLFIYFFVKCLLNIYECYSVSEKINKNSNIR